MAINFVYPTSAELREVEQEKLPRLTQERPIFQILPMESVNYHTLRWDQMDNYIGLQQARGLNGEPARVKRVGVKTWEVDPGVYGEYVTIDEMELTTRRTLGTFNQPVNVTDLVMSAQDQLLNRRLDRIEKTGWDLLIAQTYSILGPTGAVIHKDDVSGLIQTLTAGITWVNAATAVPLANFRAAKLLGRGKGVSFGAGAKCYMNSTMVNQMLANTNSADLYGRRVTGLATANNLAMVNTLLMADNLPQIVEYDEGYIDDAGSFQLFIPDNKALLVGKRNSSAVLGGYRFTRNVNNPEFAPGPYQRIVIKGQDNDDPPLNIRVHDGFNGGPVVYFPSSFVIMTI